jgi:hypothetical protein
MAKKSDIHNDNTRRKQNLHAQHCNTVLFKKKNFNSFMKDLNSFLSKDSSILLMNSRPFNFYVFLCIIVILK